MHTDVYNSARILVRSVNTKDHQEMVAYLKSKGVKIIVMASPSLARVCDPEPCFEKAKVCLDGQVTDFKFAPAAID